MKILLFSSAFNGLSQRIHRELSLMGHHVSVELALNPDSALEAAAAFQPDLIICPFLQQKIPEEIWTDYVCLIVHPGIEGDRGCSSLDWAISSNTPIWGVTVLQAAEDMDAGDIWATGNFTLRNAPKSSIYRREVTKKAAELVKDAISNYQNTWYKPRPLDYTDPNVKGQLNPFMKQMDRRIDWHKDTTATIVHKIHAADSQPGLLDEILGTPVYLYGAREEPNLRGKPGDIIAQSHGAICRATVDGAVWIKQAKLAKMANGKPGIKLPAIQALASTLLKSQDIIPSTGFDTSACEDIKTYINNDIAYFYFNFSAGAFNSYQCRQLRDKLIEIKQSPVKTIVLMGGEDFWSNGIHLNCIEADIDPAKTAWTNIQMIDDLVLEIINTPNQVTVAALRNNAGAGGAIMALACDRVIIREGVILNPHYQSMHLYGSEYWTYLLPKRVGEYQAQKIMSECLPMHSSEAVELNFADEQFEEEWANYHLKLVEFCEGITKAEMWKELIHNKSRVRERDEKEKPLQLYREEELKKMHDCFYDPQSKFHAARHDFVHKVAPEETPPQLAVHRHQWTAKKRASSRWAGKMTAE